LVWLVDDQAAELPLRGTVEDIRAIAREFRMTLIIVQDSLKITQAMLTTASNELRATTSASRQTLRAATRAIQGVDDNSISALAAIESLAVTSNAPLLAAQPELQRC